MGLETETILDVLRGRDIKPIEEEAWRDLPGIGQLEGNEELYKTTLEQVLAAEGPQGLPEAEDTLSGPEDTDDRLGRLLEELNIARRGNKEAARHRRSLRPEAPEPHCAWYCPVHFFGAKWGIYIREDCVASTVRDLIPLVDWQHSAVASLPPIECLRQLLRSAFYELYLHEHFHHKVESFGFRLLVSTNTDIYRRYKIGVYGPSWGTSDCLEESLANGDSYRRLAEERYRGRVAKPIRTALRSFLRQSFRRQPPGYREADRYLSERSWRNGLHLLQSQILEGSLGPNMRPSDWLIAPGVITSLMDITDEIYLIVPAGMRPLLPWTQISPSAGPP